MNARSEQEDIDLALAISLSDAEASRCRQSDAFLSTAQLPNRNRNRGEDRQQPPQGSRGEPSSFLPNYSSSYRDSKGGDAPLPQSSQGNSSSFLSNLLTRRREPAGNPTDANPTRQSRQPPSSVPQNQPRQPSRFQSAFDEMQHMLGATRCSGCRNVIVGMSLSAMGGIYHPGCFVCAACGGNLSSGHYEKGDPPLPYHKACAEEIFSIRCTLCDVPLVGQYLSHTFFKDEIFCTRHESSRQCFSCHRREPQAGKTRKEGFTELHDGRVSCVDCISTAILDSSEARPLYLEAVDYMEHVLHLPIPAGMRDVPVLAVDLPSLNDQQRNSRYESHRRGGPEVTGITRGMTLSTVGTVSHMTAGSFFNHMTGYFTSGAPQVYHIEEVREITAVLVLFALPKDLTASILAHEAMHVWLKLTRNMPSSIPLKIEEGLCQVISRSYLENVSTTASALQGNGFLESHGNRRSEFQAALRQLDYCPSSSIASSKEDKRDRILRTYLCCQIETDQSAVYGDGFREVQNCVTVLGLDIVLEELRNTGRLPLV